MLERYDFDELKVLGCYIPLSNKKPVCYNSPELFEKADKGLVMLGGCCIEDDSHKWYCKRDEKGFS